MDIRHNDCVRFKIISSNGLFNILNQVVVQLLGNTFSPFCLKMYQKLHICFSFGIYQLSYFLADCTAPFAVGIRTDGVFDADGTTANNDEDNTLQSRGICLDYVQIPC